MTERPISGVGTPGGEVVSVRYYKRYDIARFLIIATMILVAFLILVLLIMAMFRA